MSEPARAILLTGLPSSGKSTLGEALTAHLKQTRRTHLLDGDELRQGLPPNLGFSVEDRRIQGQRALYITQLLVSHDVTVVVAVICPLAETRQAFRDALGDRFLEVHLDVAQDVRAARDSRGIYAKARDRGDEHYASIDDVYETPEHPDVRLDTASLSVGESLQRVLSALDAR